MRAHACVCQVCNYMYMYVYVYDNIRCACDLQLYTVYVCVCLNCQSNVNHLYMCSTCLSTFTSSSSSVWILASKYLWALWWIISTSTSQTTRLSSPSLRRGGRSCSREYLSHDLSKNPLLQVRVITSCRLQVKNTTRCRLHVKDTTRCRLQVKDMTRCRLQVKDTTRCRLQVKDTARCRLQVRTQLGVDSK